MGKKTYAQYCAVAKALDHIGERWTLLIVRELLVAPRRYSEIRKALPGIATNLLAERLRDLEADDIVSKEPDGRYSLTSFGRGLEPVIHGLVTWGGRWMTTRGGDEAFRPEWLVVALAGLLPRKRSGRVEMRVDGYKLHIDRGRIGLGGIDDPDAVVEAPAETVLAVVAGHAPPSRLKVRGARALALATLRSRA